MPVFEDPVVREILDRYRTIWSLHHALGLLSWDSETYMPRGGVRERSYARAELGVLARRLLLSDEMVSLVERARGVEGLNVYERGVVRVLYRQIRIWRSVPEKLVYELLRVSEEATHAWREARRRADFSMFRPYLERVVEIRRRMAESIGYEGHPYDALLDLYEEGLTVGDVDRIFDSILGTLRKALEKVRGEGYFPEAHELEGVAYDVGSMRRVNERVLDLLGFPWDRGRLDVSPHPFTNSLGVGDVRITTRYEGRDFRHTLFAVIHEYGHALYELQVDGELAMTPLAGGASMGVHESQSRFWENVVGRSRAFTPLLKPILDEHLDFVRGVDEEELYRYFNTVRPGYIRVEADELTYNFHIYLRYVIERDLIGGDMRVDDVPEAWGDLMEELLGVRPRNDAEGALQDIHWSSGSIGYFPSYTIGNVLAAQIWAHADSKLGGLYRAVGEGRLGDVRAYLRETIHRWGATFSPKELVERQLGEPLNPEHFNRYITRKFIDKAI